MSGRAERGWTQNKHPGNETVIAQRSWIPIPALPDTLCPFDEGTLVKSSTDVVKTEVLRTRTFYMSDRRAGEQVDMEAAASDLTRRSSGTVGVEFLN